MENIYDTNDKLDRFDFSKMELTKPTPVLGGNHFIRFLVNNGQHLYVQPPKCTSKQGIVKVGKRYYCDLMFTNENEHFIRWLENLETYCHKYIYNNREKWFDNDMEMHDIENYFTSPIKLYKSGTYYTIRSNIQTVLDKPKLKIYNEEGIEVDFNVINSNTQLMTILEIQGIRCSPRSFQIDIEIKQVMALKPNNIFDNCLFKPTISSENASKTKTDNKHDPSTSHVNEAVNQSICDRIVTDNKEDKEKDESVEENAQEEILLDDTKKDDLIDRGEEVEDERLGISINTELTATDSTMLDKSISDTENVLIEMNESNIKQDESNVGNKPIFDKNADNVDNVINETNEMQEVVFNLEELPENDQITLKRRNDVYYEMYKEARQKAKDARNLALSSYLEAKNIKNKYMLDDIDDSDESDLESDE